MLQGRTLACRHDGSGPRSAEGGARGSLGIVSSCAPFPVPGGGAARAFRTLDSVHSSSPFAATAPHAEQRPAAARTRAGASRDDRNPAPSAKADPAPPLQ